MPSISNLKFDDTINAMNHSVGVIIPTFERPYETNRAVESVLAQSFKAERVIVIDDGSSKDSFSLLKSLLSDKENVDLFSIKASLHPGIARRSGFERLETDWIAFLDSDDFWYPDKLKSQIEMADMHQTGALCSNAEIFSPSLGETYSTNFESGFVSKKLLLRRNIIINSSVLVAREILKKSGGLEERYSMRGAEDYVTWLKVSRHEQWYMCEEKLVGYVDDIDNSVRKSASFPEIDSQVQGLIGLFYSVSRNRLKSQLLKFVLRNLVS
jgi:glycosyltransferase involved in cell wall biosynthesis